MYFFAKFLCHQLTKMRDHMESEIINKNLESSNLRAGKRALK